MSDQEMQEPVDNEEHVFMIAIFPKDAIECCIVTRIAGIAVVAECFRAR